MNEWLNWSEYVALIYPFPLPKKYIFLPVRKHVLHVEPVSDGLVICGVGLFLTLWSLLVLTSFADSYYRVQGRLSRKKLILALVSNAFHISWRASSPSFSSMEGLSKLRWTFDKGGETLELALLGIKSWGHLEDDDLWDFKVSESGGECHVWAEDSLYSE